MPKNRPTRGERGDPGWNPPRKKKEYCKNQTYCGERVHAGRKHADCDPISTRPCGGPQAARGRILGPPWRPAGPQKASKIAQVAPKCLTILSYALALLVTYFQGHFRNAPWHHSGRFREPRGSKIIDFRMIFRHILIRF